MIQPPHEPVERSIGSVIRDLTDDLRTLLRAEIALAKLEIKQSLAGVGGATAMFAGAGFLAAMAGVLLIVTLILVLALWMPAWAATLIVAILMLIGAGLFAFAGKKKLERTTLTPTATIESVRTDIETVRAGMRRDTDEQF